jgi:uncharacterized MAPEG superfamily protein
MAHPVVALWAMIGYVAWTFVIVTLVLLARMMMMLREGKKMNEFPGGVQHGSPGYWRLYRAHMNIIENLPIVLPSLWLYYAFATPAGIWLWLPLIALGGRILQSLAHMASGSVAAVTVRFTGFMTQNLCVGAMLFIVARKLM